MVEYIIGAAIGAGAMYMIYSTKLKGQETIKRESDRLNSELEMQRKKRSVVEKENLKLRDDIIDLKKQVNRKEDKISDWEDDLEDEKRKSAKLNKELEQLHQSLNEYKDALQACQLEVKSLKNQ